MPSTRLRLIRAMVFLAVGAWIAAAALPVRAQNNGGSAHRGGFASMPRVQGVVTAISGSDIKVKAEDGTLSTVSITDNTRIMRSQARADNGVPGSGGPGGPAGGGPGMHQGMGGMQTIKVADIKVGDGILSIGQIDPSTKTLHAMFAVVTDAAVLKEREANLGKTYITGKVTAVDLDNARLTVKRPDGVSQTIGLDESTSFRRGGRGGRPGGDASAETAAPGAESITLADVKVGDSVIGNGSVKNGSFVPAQLIVMSPHTHEAGHEGGHEGGHQGGHAGEPGMSVTPPPAPPAN